MTTYLCSLKNLEMKKTTDFEDIYDAISESDRAAFTNLLRNVRRNRIAQLLAESCDLEQPEVRGHKSQHGRGAYHSLVLESNEELALTSFPATEQSLKTFNAIERLRACHRKLCRSFQS